MAFTILDSTGPIVSVKISGELDRSEVTQIQAAALKAIQRCGKISALFILDEFRGWKRDGNWGDISFMTQHDEDISKIAVVGEEQWRDMICAFLAKGFRAAAVEYFLPADLAKARAWLEAEKA
ncbi:MAG TPA: STAS/SEC14 domain-containing protein [Phototrophicaceae bacterium]|jgi:stage II sporulation SpoAA-like protein|nr:STAS/SEC14 domain-containing protein [Phototrophicaceae bacterium]